MILQCSNCGSRFVVDPDAIGIAGRRVRCGRCRHEWWARATPEELAAPPPTPSQPTPAAADTQPPALPVPAKRRRFHRFGWALFVIVVAAIVGTAAWREQIMLRYPATQKVYAAFGVQPRDLADGISIVDIFLGSQVDAGAVMLVVEGRIENIAPVRRRVPPLLATLYDDGDREVYRWTFTVEEPLLEAGDSVAFRTAIRPPEREFSRVTISAVRRVP